MTKGASQFGGLGYSQPGTWQTGDAPWPVPASRETRFVSIQTGEHHVLALTDDGKVYAWGDNSLGQVGI